MLRISTSIKMEPTLGSSDKNQKGIENRKKALTHFEATAKNHGKAIKRAIITQHNKWMSTEYQLELVNPFCD